MAVYTTELSTTITYENLLIYNKMEDGKLYGYVVKPAEGYKMYDTKDEYVEYNPETDEEIPVIHYVDSADLPLNYNFDNFSYVAVPA